MDGTVYEALGRYVDSLSNSLYLGTGRGTVYLEGEPVTPEDVRLSLFFSGKSIEISSLWGRKRYGVLYLRGSPKVRVHLSKIELLFLTRRGRVTVRLNADRGFARVLVNTASQCSGGIGSLWVRG
ncbi:hypothetical protein [Thermococcus sp.]|uniref:hypothetical protein n=1 Tax=Thermococcus sp. TaxID=35749 RepID=UPI0025DF5334|nr:hypothetical protein [Thermococcus sp.]